MKNLGNATKEQVEQYRAAMIADGWDHKPTYGSLERRVGESEEAAMSLSKDGFKCQTLLRDPNTEVVHYDINFWGPDGLVVAHPLTYSMDDLRAALRYCGYCGANDVDTGRMSFAGRCCQKCRKDQKVTSREEPPGWTN